MEAAGSIPAAYTLLWRDDGWLGGREGNNRAIAVGRGRTLDPDWNEGTPGRVEKRVARRAPAADGARRGLQCVPLVGGAFLWGGKVYR
jgi:hypothetical protein